MELAIATGSMACLASRGIQEEEAAARVEVASGRVAAAMVDWGEGIATFGSLNSFSGAQSDNPPSLTCSFNVAA
jgi:hypothetical protein